MPETVTRPVRAGVQRIILNGSFVTDIMKPHDVGCVLLIGAGSARDEVAEGELLQGLAFLDLSFARPTDFDYFVHRFLAYGWIRHPKGMIEAIL